jgi:hypothetical protein
VEEEVVVEEMEEEVLRYFDGNIIFNTSTTLI